MKRLLATAITYLFFCLSLVAQNVTIEVHNQPASDVFRSIMKQTGMNFIYSSDLLKDLKVSVVAKNKPLITVLDEVFRDTKIKYEIKKNSVILKTTKKKKKQKKVKVPVLSLNPKVEPEVTLDEVIISSSGATRNLKAAEMGRHVFGSDVIMKLPVLLGEPDVIKTLQTLPGVSQGVEGFTGLYVHGGENDQNLFLYNGLPLYHVSHLGGIFSSFNVSTISKVDFYKSAFPARYGGRISSITDIRMADPDFTKYTGRFSIGLLAGSAYISGPIIKERLAFTAGIRRSWIDIVGLPTLAVINAIQKKNGKKTIANYNFTDFNARIDWKIRNGKIYAIGYYGHDYLKIGSREFEGSIKTIPVITSPIISMETRQIPPDPNDIKFYDENSNRLSWGNWGVSVNADYRLGDGFINATAYYSKYVSHYNQWNEHQSDLEDPDTYGRSYDATYNSIGDLGINVQYMHQWKDTWLLKTGAEYVYHNYHPEGLINEYVDDDRFWKEVNGNPSIKSNELLAYIDNLFHFGEKASLDVGLRFVDHFIEGVSFPRLEPRISFRFNLTDNFSLKASYARINQFVQQVSTNYINLPTDLWQPIGEGKKPLQSNQYSIGLYGNLGKGLYFSLEGWYKDMNNIVEYREGISSLNPNLPWDAKTVSGRGWAYGADVSITKEIGKLTGTISYGLMWNWRKFKELNEGKRFPAKFDNRNKINITASYKLNDKIEFNAGWTFMTGNRMTLALYNYETPGTNFPDAPHVSDDHVKGSEFAQHTGIGYYPERNNIRLPAYHRLDLGMSLFKNLKKGGRTIWNFSLYNAYCHWNTITIVKESEWLFSSNRRFFRKLSLIPIVPSVSWTYEF